MHNLLLDKVKRRNFSAEYLEQEDPAAHPNYEKNSRRFAKLPKFKNLRISPVFLIGAIATIAVPINALFFQDGRHPAPLFSNKFNSAETKIVLSPPPIPPTRPDEIASNHEQLDATKIDNTHHHSKLSNEPTDSIALRGINRSAHKMTKDKENEELKKDQISQLLEKPRSTLISQDQQVLFVQRALLKLGYVVRANGIWNKATKDALAKFQKDNGLTIHKAVTSKLISLLAMRAGLESE